MKRVCEVSSESSETAQTAGRSDGNLFEIQVDVTRRWYESLNEKKHLRGKYLSSLEALVKTAVGF